MHHLQLRQPIGQTNAVQCSLRRAITEIVPRTGSMYVAECWPGGHAHIPLGFQNGENFLHGIVIFSVGDATATVPASSGTCPLSQLDGSTGCHNFF